MKRLLLGLLLLASPAYAADFTNGTPFTATGDLDGTTDVSLKAAVTGSTHCVTSIQVSSLVAGSDQTVRLLSNDTVIWAYGVDTALSYPTSAVLNPPVCTASGEALEIDVDGNPTDDLIIYSLQGVTK